MNEVRKVRGEGSPISSRLLSRRQFLSLSSVAAVTSTFALAGARLNENKQSFRGISDNLYAQLIQESKKYPSLGIGIYPGFENDVQSAWDTAASFEHNVGRLDFLGLFALLQDAHSDEFIKPTLQLLGRQLDQGKTPILSLGLGSAMMQGHPFDPVNTDRIAQWIDQWVRALLTFPKDKQIIVRFLFEFNLPEGYIAYKLDHRISRSMHRRQFRAYFAYFAQQLAEYQMPQIQLAFCPGSGADFRPYIPDCTIGAVGFDHYDQFDPANIFSLYSLVAGPHDAYLAFCRLLKGTAQIAKERNIPLFAFEVGSRTGDIDWYRAVTATLFSQGGNLIRYVVDNSALMHQRPEEASWAYTDEELLMLYSIFSDRSA